jgi:PIN domain nuclease of toxin-antitoxin system
MTYLLDTQCFLWWLAAPERLNGEARQVIGTRANRIVVSAATSWEIAIKWAIGKLPLPEPPDEFVPKRLAREGFDPLPIEHEHALAVAALPPHHRDPFDRLLIAQARLEKITLVTADEQMRAYSIDLLWARA